MDSEEDYAMSADDEDILIATCGSQLSNNCIVTVDGINSFVATNLKDEISKHCGRPSETIQFI